MRTLIDGVRPEDVVLEPFPHLIIRDPLEAAECDRLIAEYPSVGTLAEGQPAMSNRRFSYSAHKVAADASVSPAWKGFVASHVSQDFLDKLVRLFVPAIRNAYPGRLPSGGGPGLRAGVRKRDGFDTADVLLDAQICVNTPVTAAPTSVREAHVDDPRKLFAGLFYMRRPEDDSVGGDLELYRPVRNRPRFHDGQMVEADQVELVKTVKYEKNVLVLFLNGVNAFHGVSVRQRTAHPRLFLNLVGEVKEPLFDLASRQENRVKRLMRRFGLIGKGRAAY